MNRFVEVQSHEHLNNKALQGKTRNFANPALHDAIITFMYTGPYRIVQRHPDIFSKQLPLSCLALVCAAVFSQFHFYIQQQTDFFHSSFVFSMASSKMAADNHSQNSPPRNMAWPTNLCWSHFKISWKTLIMVPSWLSSSNHGLRLDGKDILSSNEFSMLTVFDKILPWIHHHYE